jgi:outer membrane protein, protease secretion system
MNALHATSSLGWSPAGPSASGRYGLFRLKTAAGTLLLALAWPVAAEPVDLWKHYLAAVQHDPRFRAAQAERDAGLEERALGRSLLLPTLNASVSTERGRLRANEREVLSATSQGQSRSFQSEQSLTSTDRASSDSFPSSTSTGTHLLTTQSNDASTTGHSLSDEAFLESGRGTTASGAVQLRQPLINFGALAGYRQGKLRAEASESRFRAQQQDLMVRVTEAYAQVLFSMDNQRLASSQLATLVEQQVTNERMLAAGEGTLTDVLETRAKRELAQAQLIEAEDNLATARKQLRALTGLDVGDLAPLSTQLMGEASAPSTAEEWRDLALSRNGLLESLKQQVAATSEEVRRADAGHYPRLDLVATWGRDERRNTSLKATSLNTAADQNQNSTSSSTSLRDSAFTSNLSSTPTPSSSTESSTSTGQSNSQSSSSTTRANADTNRRYSTSQRIGLELNVPLFAGGAISARARQAAARLTQAQAEMDAEVDRILLDLDRQWRLQLTTAQRVRALNQAVRSSQVMIEATSKSLAAGVRTNLDVINARERLVTAERELASARYLHLLAFVRLRFHAGVLAETDLQRATQP